MSKKTMSPPRNTVRTPPDPEPTETSSTELKTSPTPGSSSAGRSDQSTTPTYPPTPCKLSKSSPRTTRRTSRKIEPVNRIDSRAPPILSATIVDPDPLEVAWTQNSTSPTTQSSEIPKDNHSDAPATPVASLQTDLASFTSNSNRNDASESLLTSLASKTPSCDADQSSDSLEEILTPSDYVATSEKRTREAEDDETDWIRPKRPTFYSADFKPRKTAASNDSPSGTNSPARKTRGGGASRKRGGKPGNGRPGRGRARGGGRAGRNGGDSPDRKNATDPEAKALLATLKARQQDLKRFFAHVGNYQLDTLEAITNRDISLLQRKPNTHKKVPEYDSLLEDLGQHRERAEELAHARHEVAEAAAMQEYEAEKWIIEERCKMTGKHSSFQKSSS